MQIQCVWGRTVLYVIQIRQYNIKYWVHWIVNSGGLCTVCHTKYKDTIQIHVSSLSCQQGRTMYYCISYKLQLYNTNTVSGGGLCIVFYTKYNNTILKIQVEWSTVEDTKRGTRHSLLIVLIVNFGQGLLLSPSGFSDLSWMVLWILIISFIISLFHFKSEAKHLRRSAI